MAVALAVPWLALGRGFSHKLTIALGFLLVASGAAAAVVECLMHLLRGTAGSARLAAALIVLILGTAGLFCSMTALLAMREHLSEGLPPHILLLIFMYVGAASLYNALAVGGWLLLPLGLPLILGYAALIARPGVEASPPRLLSRPGSSPGPRP